MRKPNVWMLICIFVILAMMLTIQAHQKIININFFDAGQVLSDLQYYILSTLLYYSFKSKSSFWVLMLFWVSMDAVGRSGLASGVEKHAWYALLSLFTCTFTLSQYKPNVRSEEHTSELQSRQHLVCRLLLEKKKTRSHTGP